MPYQNNSTDYIIESINSGAANANGIFRNVNYSGTLQSFPGSLSVPGASARVNAGSAIVFDNFGNAFFRDMSYTGTLKPYGVTLASNYGYHSGGNTIPSSLPVSQRVERYPFALAITNSTTVGTCAYNTNNGTGASSSSYGYHAHGQALATSSPGGGVYQTIERFPFALAITNAATVGGGTLNSAYRVGTMSSTYGYMCCGTNGPVSGARIERYPFALAITNATTVGNSTTAREYPSGAFSYNFGYGYIAGGGTTPGAILNVIDRFPFALAITNGTNVGTLATNLVNSSGQSSDTYGYSAGGSTVYAVPYSPVNTIQRWPFALAITNTTNVGTLSLTNFSQSGQSSGTYGYCSGGTNSGVTARYANIDRWPFSLSITNASNVGNLTAGRGFGSKEGQQY